MALRVTGSTTRSGRALQAGVPGVARIGPSPGGVWLGPPGGARPLAALDFDAEPGGTYALGPGWRIGVVEHLLAAVVGLGVRDVTIEVEGPELPALDGSARAWCVSLREAGLAPQAESAPRRLARAVRVEDFGGVAVARPSPAPRVAVRVDFGPDLRGEATWEADPSAFEAEIAGARTFVFADQIEALRAAGRGLGATPENTLVVGEARGREGWRWPDEPVRHKLLDLIGDLAWAGWPWAAEIEVDRGSHRLHTALARAMRAAEESPP